MPTVRYDKNGTRYIVYTEAEYEALKPERDAARARQEPLPETPEGWVQFEERFIARSRAAVAAEDPDYSWPQREQPQYDHWRLWVIYQLRKGLLGTGGLRYCAECLPDYVSLDGTPDVSAISENCQRTPRTVRKWLADLVKLGADFSRIHDWPHPLTGATQSQHKQNVH